MPQRSNGFPADAAHSKGTICFFNVGKSGDSFLRSPSASEPPLTCSSSSSETIVMFSLFISFISIILSIVPRRHWYFEKVFTLPREYAYIYAGEQGNVTSCQGDRTGDRGQFSVSFFISFLSGSQDPDSSRPSLPLLSALTSAIFCAAVNSAFLPYAASACQEKGSDQLCARGCFYIVPEESSDLLCRIPVFHSVHNIVRLNENLIVRLPDIPQGVVVADEPA